MYLYVHMYMYVLYNTYIHGYHEESTLALMQIRRYIIRQVRQTSQMKICTYICTYLSFISIVIDAARLVAWHVQTHQVPLL